MKILIADDSPSDLSMLLDAAADVFPTHEIRSALGFGEALELVETDGPFDLVVSDVLLGLEGDGFELCRRIKRQCPKTVVFLITGSYSAIDTRATQDCGASGMLIKPEVLQDYREQLAEVAERQSNGNR